MPGLHILIHAIISFESDAVNPASSTLPITQHPINVPVLPNPALQCTATAYPFSTWWSTIYTNLPITLSDGFEPSGNSSECTLMFSRSNVRESYSFSFNLITPPTFASLNPFNKSRGWQLLAAVTRP